MVFAFFPDFHHFIIMLRQVADAVRVVGEAGNEVRAYGLEVAAFLALQNAVIELFVGVGVYFASAFDFLLLGVEDHIVFGLVFVYIKVLVEGFFPFVTDSVRIQVAVVFVPFGHGAVFVFAFFGCFGGSIFVRNCHIFFIHVLVLPLLSVFDYFFQYVVVVRFVLVLRPRPGRLLVIVDEVVLEAGNGLDFLQLIVIRIIVKVNCVDERQSVPDQIVIAVVVRDGGVNAVVQPFSRFDVAHQTLAVNFAGPVGFEVAVDAAVLDVVVDFLLLFVENHLFDHVEVDFSINHKPRNVLANVLNIAQELEQVDVVHQLVVLAVAQPRGDGDAVLRVVLVTYGVVVEQDHILQVDFQDAQVLDVKTVCVYRAVIPEKSISKFSFVGFYEVQQGIGVLLLAGREHHQIIVLAHFVQENFEVRAFVDEDVVDFVFEVDFEEQVGFQKVIVVRGVTEKSPCVHQSFVQIQD